jgi:hypothetical protein
MIRQQTNKFLWSLGFTTGLKTLDYLAKELIGDTDVINRKSPFMSGLRHGLAVRGYEFD